MHSYIFFFLFCNPVVLFIIILIKDFEFYIEFLLYI